MLSTISLPSLDATLTFTIPARTPISPLPGSPLAKIAAPRATFRVFMYEPRCSITVDGRSRNSGWLRSRDSLSRTRSVGRLSADIDMSYLPTKYALRLPNLSAPPKAHDHYSVSLSLARQGMKRDLLMYSD